MDWVQTLTIIGVNIALIGAFIGVLIHMMNKLDSDIKSMGSRLDTHIAASNQRMDQMYGIIIDMLKDRK